VTDPTAAAAVPAPLGVAFYFDPACPFAWLTSRWITLVAHHRDLAIDWRPYSLTVKNAGVAIPEEYRAPMQAGHRALRVVAAALAAGAPAEKIGRLSTEFGRRIHHEGDPLLVGLTAAVVAAGFDAGLAAFADDETLDAAVTASTDEGRALVGDDVGVPIVAPEGAQAFFGPVISRVPDLDGALRLWDGLLLVAGVDHVFEIKRTRTGSLEL
jgi:2-hydroxychromene-2-carboxylate isomerase